MNYRRLRTLTFVAALLLAGANATAATEYYVVVPLKGAQSSQPEDPDKEIDVSLSSFALPEGLVGQPYNGANLANLLVVTGDPDYSGAGVTWLVTSGSLPVGLVLGSDGRITGTPQSQGMATFSVQASYKTKAGFQTYQLDVIHLNVTLDDVTSRIGVQGQTYSLDLRNTLRADGVPVTNGASFVLRSALPPGLSFSNGQISGTPTTPGNFRVTVAGQYRGFEDIKDYPIAVYSLTPRVVPATLPRLKVGRTQEIDFKNFVALEALPSLPANSYMMYTLESFTFEYYGLHSTLSADGRWTVTPTRADTAGQMVKFYVTLYGVDFKPIQAYGFLTLFIDP